MKKTKLCVLFGGRSSEYEVSLKSAYSVLSNADREKYDILPVGITKEGDWYFFEGGYESVPDGSWCADTSAMKRVALDLAGSAFTRGLVKHEEDQARYTSSLLGNLKQEK